jgi:hypothetical protein
VGTYSLSSEDPSLSYMIAATDYKNEIGVVGTPLTYEVFEGE